MSTSQNHKQSKYFDSLKLKADLPSIPVHESNNFSSVDTFSSNNSYDSNSNLNTTSSLDVTKGYSFNSPLRSPFTSKFDDSKLDNSSPGFGSSHSVSPHSPYSITLKKEQLSPNSHNSFDISPLKRNSGSNLTPPLQNRFVSNHSSSKSHTPSPSKRFSKLRLNNTENINYSNMSSNNSLHLPSISSNNPYLSTSYSSPAKEFIERTSNRNKFDGINNNNNNNNNINDKYMLNDHIDIDAFDNLSLQDTNDSQSLFFKQPMYSPTYQNDSSLFSSPTSANASRRASSQFLSPIKISSNNNSADSLSTDPNFLPINMKIICNSRAEHNIHSITGFSNAGYMEFWNLTPEEGKIYKDWNKLQFETQSLVFEIFTNLKKIRFNLHRLIFIYGLEFKETGLISDSVYDKTFEVLQEFYYFLDKLVVKKLKPLFDDHFFVDDSKVLKILTNWFKQLKLQYHHISCSVVYLSKLSSNEDVKSFIVGISKKDIENSSNRSAVAPVELFNSYFVKLFTSIELLFDRIKSIYKESNNMKNFESAENLQNIIKTINNISDTTSDLEKKIAFNEQLSYKTEIDFSHMEMVDMFNQKRKSKEPLKLEIKINNLNWMDVLLAPFDNYLVILQIKSNSIKDEYVMHKIPIAIQYLEIDSYVDGNYKIVIIKDIGNKSNYHFRKLNDITVAILDRFLKDLQNLKNEFWKNMKENTRIDLKVFNTGSFIRKAENYEPFKLSSIPIEHNIVKHAIEQTRRKSANHENYDEFEPILAEVQACDYFTYTNYGITDRLCIFGTSLGLFIGKASDYKSIYKVHQISNVKKIIVLNNDVVFCICNGSLYHLSIDKLYQTYKNKFPPCDINVFIENKRNISDFTVGYQSSIKGVGSPYIFAWNNKIVYYTELLKENNFKFNWQSFKTHYNIVRLQTVYANNFAVGHIIENSAVWNLSKLSDIRALALNQLDIKDILKNEVPIGIFPYPNEENNISEVLVVFSRFCTRMKNVKGKYVQSDDEIIWFGLPCENASFDCEEKILITVGKQSVEIRSLFDSSAKRSELIGCLSGSSFLLVNDMPGKAILRVQDIDGNEEYKKQYIFKIRRVKILK